MFDKVLIVVYYLEYLDGLNKVPTKATKGPANKRYQPHLNFICFSKKLVMPLKGIKLKLVLTFNTAANNNKVTSPNDAHAVSLTSLG